MVGDVSVRPYPYVRRGNQSQSPESLSSWQSGEWRWNVPWVIPHSAPTLLNLSLTALTSGPPRGAAPDTITLRLVRSYFIVARETVSMGKDQQMA